MGSTRPRSGGGRRQPKFIYDLPLRQYKDIEDILNMNEAWEQLGQLLGFTITEVEKYRCAALSYWVKLFKNTFCFKQAIQPEK